METTNSQGQRLFYETLGHGEPLILLPGSSQSHLAFVDSGLAEALAERFEVCLMDFTGLGRSERVSSMKTSQWCEDVISVMDAASYPRAHIGGTSLGARVGARVAAEYPRRLKTLLIDLPITAVSDAEEAFISSMFVNYAESPLAKGWQRWHGESWHEAMDFFVVARAQSGFRGYYSPRSYIADIEAPTLICRSDEENTGHPLAMAFEWHRLARDSRLWIEPHAPSPALTMVSAGEVARQFSQFVANVSTRSAV